MPYRKEPFENNEIYHITTRRIGDELLFKDTNDYYRGVFSIYEFNNSNPVEIRKRREARARLRKEQSNGDPTSATLEEDKRNKFVEILVFSQMPNHIHLLLRQIQDNGISKFMQKFGTGYASYFKEKHEQKRKEYFFQRRFSSVPIKTEDQLRTVFVYIHTNPISLCEPNWKDKGIAEPEKVIEFLENYKWSSYLDYIGKRNFPSVTEREFLSEIMGGEESCRKSIEEWVRYKGEIKEFANLALEE